MRSHCARSRALRLAAALVLLVAVHALDVPLVMRQTTVGDSHGGSGFTVQPLVQKGEPPCTVIIMHGMGTDGEEWAYLALTISYLSLNYVKFVVPSAPVEFITYLNVTAPSWFDIPKLAIDEDVNKRDLLESVERVHNIVKGEIAQGVDPSRIFLVGFSQGGALALSAFLRAPFELAGCVGVATWLPLDREYPRMLSDQARGKDMLIMHGTKDEAVDIAFAERTVKKLKAIGQNVNYTRVQNAPHVMISTSVMEALEQFITKRAPGTTGYLNTLVTDLTENFASLSASMRL